MNNLPDELILMIFDHLGFRTLITSCRLVCKKWLQLVRMVKIKEIVTSNRSFSRFGTDFWCFNFEPIDQKSLCFCYPEEYSLVHELNILDQPFKANFINLKRMKIYWGQTVFDIRKLEFLFNLEHLELEGVRFDTAAHVCLPKLKILKISLSGELTIDSNNLEVLISWQLKPIKLAKPHTLKHIEVVRSEKENLKEYSSLEFYKCVNVTILDHELMFKIPDSLKELHLNCFNHIEVSSFPMSYEEVMGRVLEQRSRLGKNKLKIYFKNVELIDGRPFEEYGFNKYQDFGGDDQYLLNEIHRNYNYLADYIPWLKTINYTKLMDKFEQKLPSTFFSKFPAIISISADSSFDKDHFIWFLKNCKVTSLSICNTLPDSDFLKRLPDLCPLLNALTLKFNTKENLNYDFLYKFERLTSLKVNDLPVDHVRNLLGKLANISFRFFEKEIYVHEDHVDNKLFVLVITETNCDDNQLNSQIQHSNLRNGLYKKAVNLNLDQLKKIFQNLELFNARKGILETLNEL